MIVCFKRIRSFGSIRWHRADQISSVSVRSVQSAGTAPTRFQAYPFVRFDPLTAPGLPTV
jgi:hypothetical protein